jgi:hypothetical protein
MPGQCATTLTRSKKSVTIKATVIATMQAQLAALLPVTATGFGDARANGRYQPVDSWNGFPLYLNAATGFCHAHGGMTAWVIWDGHVRVGGAISSQYVMNDPGPTGTYTETNGPAPAGTVS